MRPLARVSRALGRGGHAQLCRPLAIAALGPAALALCAAVSLASPAGDLDSSFDGDGKLLLTDPSRVNEVLVQADGKLLVVGYGGPASDFTVTRLRPDGSIDRGFGQDGTAIADFGGMDSAHAAALQADGKLVVAGSSSVTDPPAMAVARFDTEGKLDPTFDPDGSDGAGKKLLPGAPGARTYDAAAALIQPDGRIVLVARGVSDVNDIAVTRLTATGADDGTPWERAKFDAFAEPDGAALTQDGKLVVAGVKRPDGAPTEIVLARFGGRGQARRDLRRHRQGHAGIGGQRRGRGHAGTGRRKARGRRHVEAAPVRDGRDALEERRRPGPLVGR